MSASIADLFVSIGADIAQLKSGMAEAGELIKSTGDKATKAFDGVGSRLDTVGSSIKSLAAVAGVGLTFGFLKGLVVDSAEAVASLQDLGLKAGILPSQLSAFIPAARLSGTSLETVAAASGKFAKELVNLSQGTGKGVSTFRELGFSAQDAARFLKDPAAGLFEVAKAASKYNDDGAKVAAMQRLMGKSAQELLPFLHDLGEQQQLQSVYTKEQIAGAKLLTDEWAKTKAASEILKGQLAGELAPTLIALQRTFFGTADGSDGLKGSLAKLIKDGSVKQWAEEAGLAIAQLSDEITEGPRKLAVYAEGFGLLVTSILNVQRAIGGLKLYLAGGLFGNVFGSQDKGRSEISAGLNSIVTDVKAYQQTLRDADRPAASPAVDKFRAGLAKAKEEIAAAAGAAGGAGKSFTKFTEDIDKSAERAETAAIKYRDALQQLQQARDEANAKVGLDENRSAQEDLKTGFDRGIVSLRDYYAQRNALQSEALNIEVQTLQSKLAQEESLASDYYAQAAGAQKKANETAGAFAARYTELVTAGTNAEAKAAKTKGDLTVTQNKLNGVGKDYIELLIAENKGTLQNQKALDESVKAQILENQTIGLTKSAVIDLNIARVEQLKIQEQQNANDPKTIAALDAQIDGLRRLGAATKEGEGIQQVVDSFRELESIGKDVFDSLFDKGQDTFAKLGQAVKKLLLDVLFNATVRPFLINVVASVTGTNPGAFGVGPGGLTQALTQALTGGSGGGSGGGILSSLFNTAGNQGASSLAGGALDALFATGAGTSLSAGLFSSLGGAGAAQAAALAAQTAAFGTAGTTATLGALGGAGAGAAGAGAIGTVAAAIPVIGWAVAAAAAIYAVVQANKKPSPVEGQFAIRQLGVDPSVFEDNTSTQSQFGQVGFLDQGTKQFSGEAGQVLNQSVSGLLDLFVARYTKEQKTQATTALQALQFPHFEGTFTTEDFLKKYGDKILKQVAITAFDVLDPALGKVVDGFDGTGESLTKFIGSLLIFDDVTKKLPPAIRASLTAAIGSTQEGLEKVLDFAGAFQKISDVIAANPIQDIADARARSTPVGAFDAAAANLQKVTDEFDGTTQSAAALADATQALYTAQVQLLAQIEQVRAALSNMFDDTIRGLRLSVLDVVGQGQFLNNEIGQQQQIANQSNDPAAIQAAGQTIISDIRDLFNLDVQQFRDSLQGQNLTPDQIDAQVRTFSQDLLNNEFLPRITEVENNINSHLTALGVDTRGTSTDLIQNAQTVLATAITALGDAATASAAAATANADAAASQNNAALVQNTAADTNLQAALTPIVVTIDPIQFETNG